MGWACWWLFFGVASGIGEGLKGIALLMHAAFPGLIFLMSALLPWQWQRAGGLVLVGEGLLIFIVYPIIAHRVFAFLTIILVCLTMALPPLIAGLLFLKNEVHIQK